MCNVLEVKISRMFKTSYKKVSRDKKYKQETFDYVIFMLASQIALPEKYRDHALTGAHKDKRECHLAPDLLLIYKIEEGYLTLTLLNIRNHNSVFRK